MAVLAGARTAWATSEHGGTVSTLEEERDFLLRSLDDLEAEHARGDIDDADFHTLHDDYTARAAALIRRIDGATPPEPAPAPARPGRSHRLLVVAAVAVFAVAAGVWLARTSGERGSGDLASGSGRESSAELLVEAAEAEAAGEVIDALEAYDRILAGNPDNVEALARRGALLMRVGDERLVGEAVPYLDRALGLDPDHVVALLFRGLAHRVQGQPADARERYRQLLAVDRDLPMPRAVIEDQIAELDAEIAAG